MKYLILLLFLTGCADTQGPIERTVSVAGEWKEFGVAVLEDISE